MILSMTGYGKYQAEINGKKVTAEIRSLNSKQLDLSTRVSPYYKEKDNEIRNEILRRLERGKVDFALYTESIGEQNGAHLNIPLLQTYYQELQQASESLQLPLGNEVWTLLMRMPNVMQGDSFELPEDEWPQVQEVIAMAIDQLISFREQEGNMLYDFFSARVSRIEELLAEVEPYENSRVEKIKARIQDALEKSGAAGMAAGNLLAILFCIIQGTTHLLRLNPENYFVSFVPVNLDLGMILSVTSTKSSPVRASCSFC